MKKSKESIISAIRRDKRSTTRERRKVAALSVLGLVDFSIISLYQLGYIKSLPDLPGKVFDSDKVNASKEAEIAGLPDGVISLGLYTAGIVLATAGIRRRKKHNIFDYLLGAAALGQAAGAAQYLVNMATVQKKACPYCITGAIINFATLAPVYRLLRR